MNAVETKKEATPRPPIAHVMKIGAAPTLLGWVAAWLPRDVLAPLAYVMWQVRVRDVVVLIGAVIVLVLVGACTGKPLCYVRKLAFGATLGSVLGIVVCLALRFFVGALLHERSTVVYVRDFFWPVVYGFTLLLLMSTVTLWAFYLSASAMGVRPSQG